MKRRANHHCCTKGKRVRVVTADGETLVGKFVEERSNHIIISIDTIIKKIQKRDLYSFGIVR